MAGLRTTAAIDALDAIIALVDVGPGAAVLRLYTGSMPTYTNDAATGTQLVQFTVGTFAAASTSGNFAVSDSSAAFPLTVAATATGTAGYWRVIANNGAGNAIIQGTCGEETGDLILTSTSIVNGNNVTLNGFTLKISRV